ncbi:ABC transporter substrate-binding protein [Salipiger sp. 1_MG-2023]|uniref:ABC transporter substrate-binding protein n=1 Tax=Salipiger sp. 1_MG-2023 TaxID=3062665 RepID=UPI0026E313D0|nr:ABC transporter substrate-binding protein [Salipiger sp. 1_MG-2023]MDO6588312.1 ABC transporter substrate-binding protein [Salipiger sp. 1_MG-2023]
MEHKIISGGLAATFSLMASTAFAQDMKAEVMHWWTSGSEAAALRVLADAYEAKGGKWVDDAVPGATAAVAAATSAIVTGNAPAALQFNGGKLFPELAAQGLLTDLTPYADAGDWEEALPAGIVDAISYDGKIYAMPVANHGVNWMWFSKAALESAGTEVPETFDGFFPMLDKLKNAGIQPIAQSGEGWVIFETFYQLMLISGHLDLYKAMFQEGDVDAIESDEFREFVDIFRKYASYADQGTAGRKWNDATAMVVSGDAGVQLMGDWAKGEFKSAGQKPGVDFECRIGFGDDTYFLTAFDVFVLPKSNSESMEVVHEKLADTFMDPEVQVAFNLIKGGLPPRLDVQTEAFDSCAQRGFEAMAEPAHQVPGVEISTPADRAGGYTDAVLQLWANPDMSTDDFVDSIKGVIRSTGY